MYDQEEETSRGALQGWTNSFPPPARGENIRISKKLVGNVQTCYFSNLKVRGVVMGWDEVAVAPLHWLKQVDLISITCLLFFLSYVDLSFVFLELCGLFQCRHIPNPIPTYS